MNYVLALLSIGLPLGFGWMLLSRMGLSGHIHRALRLGAVYGVGFAVISVAVALVAALKIPLTLGWAAPMIAVVGGGVWFGVQRFAARKDSPPVSTWDRIATPWIRLLWGFGVALLIVKLGLVGIRAMHKPVIGWDAVTTHSLRAKALFYDQTILRSTLEWIGSEDYPLGVPLLELWVTWFQGHWDDTAFKILFPGFLAALLLMVYGALRERVQPLGAMIGAWLVASLPLLVQHATDAYLDLPLAYTILGTSIFLWRYTRTRGMADLLVASLMAGFGIWIKREGVVAFGVDFTLLALWMVTARPLDRRTAITTLAIFAVLPTLVWAGWAMVRWNILESAPLSLQPMSVTDLVARSVRVATYAGGELWASSNWSVLWPLFAGMWLFRVQKSLSSECLFFAWPVVLTMGVFLAVSASTEMGEYLFKGSTLHRMVLHVAPMAAMFVALALGDVWAKSVRTREGG